MLGAAIAVQHSYHNIQLPKEGLDGPSVAIRDPGTYREVPLRSISIHRLDCHRQMFLRNRPNRRHHLCFQTYVQIAVMDMQGKSPSGKQKRRCYAKAAATK